LVGNAHIHSDIRRADVGDERLLPQLISQSERNARLPVAIRYTRRHPTQEALLPTPTFLVFIRQSWPP
jgi:hypothetical protein